MRRSVQSPQRRMRLLGFRVEGTPTGVQEASTLTMDAFSDLSQGEMIRLFNADGESIVFWMDLNADGTEPTGAVYTGADYVVLVDVVTGDNTAALVGAALKAAFDVVDGVTPTGITLLDNEDGTLTATNTADGTATDGDSYDADSSAYSGGNSLDVTVGTQGVTSLVALLEGQFDATLVEGAGPGDYTLTFREQFQRIPVVAAQCLTADCIAQVAAVSKTAVQIKTFDASDGTTAKDCDFHCMVLGADAVDQY